MREGSVLTKEEGDDGRTIEREDMSVVVDFQVRYPSIAAA